MLCKLDVSPRTGLNAIVSPLVSKCAPDLDDDSVIAREGVDVI